VAVVCVLACAADIGLYTVMTGSGSRFRRVIEHKVRELDPKNRTTENNSATEGESPSLMVICRKCQGSVAASRFCSRCGSPLM
jgi:hypothetical protein